MWCKVTLLHMQGMSCCRYHAAMMYWEALQKFGKRSTTTFKCRGNML